MTIARDIRTGAVVGQVLEPRYVTAEAPASWQLTILTRDGVRTVRKSSVRLEDVR